MKKLLAIIFVLGLSFGFTSCGGGSGDPDMDKMVSLSCEMFEAGEKVKAGDISGTESVMGKVSEMQELAKKLEEKYKDKSNEEMEKMFEDAINKKCPDLYKKSKDL